jgi:nucleotide-binding universal stress UspA family protein
MPNLIMVPLDGSEKDPRALAVAAALADLSGADLHLVRVIDALPESVPARSEFRAPEEAAVTGRRDVERQITDTAARVAADTERPVTWAVLEGDDVVKELTRHTAERDARIVVMATRAPGAAERALRGSVADRVMRESPRPVVLVPPGTADMSGKHVRLERVLVPLDGSALAARAIDFLLAFPRASALEYVLLEVVPPGADPTQAEHRLDAAAGRVRAVEAKRVEAAVVEASDAAPVIIAAVREALVDVIAMSTRGASGLRRMVLGSVAEGVVRGSEVPVLLLTPASLAGS